MNSQMFHYFLPWVLYFFGVEICNIYHLKLFVQCHKVRFALYFENSANPKPSLITSKRTNDYIADKKQSLSVLDTNNKSFYLSNYSVQCLH